MLGYFAEVAILHLLVSRVVAYFVVPSHCLAYLEEIEKTRLVNLRHLVIVPSERFGVVEQCFGGLAKHEKVHLEVRCHFGVTNRL